MVKKIVLKAIPKKINEYLDIALFKVMYMTVERDSGLRAYSASLAIENF